LEGCGFESHQILDENDDKLIPGSIPAPNLRFIQSLKKIYVAQLGIPNKFIVKAEIIITNSCSKS